MDWAKRRGRLWRTAGGARSAPAGPSRSSGYPDGRNGEADRGWASPVERARAAATAVSAGLLIKAAEAFPDLFDDSGILLSPVARIAHHLLQARFRRRTIGTLSFAQQPGFVA